MDVHEEGYNCHTGTDEDHTVLAPEAYWCEEMRAACDRTQMPTLTWPDWFTEAPVTDEAVELALAIVKLHVPAELWQRAEDARLWLHDNG